MNFFWQNLGTASASRVAKVREAADRAVTRCNAARDDAIREAGLVVDVGDDVARRDEAALAAQDAAVRCVDASLAALEVAARCEAVAEEVPANLRGDATFAAELARAAAARCDVEGGAPAASRAANAFAESCHAACVHAKTQTSAALEAAACCVRARDDERTASLVFDVTGRLCDRLNPFFKAYPESYDGHTEAWKDVVAARLAARKAALRCAEASRRAVSAASVARKIASLCEAARVDGAAAAAAEARETANRCVALLVDEAVAGAVVLEATAGEVVLRADEATVGADVAEAAAGANPVDAAARHGPVVPRADAAASDARKAAVSCNEALKDPRYDADNDFLDKMRGWLMAVVTLFVGIAFQAIVRPPTGMSFDNCTLKILGPSHRKETGNAPSPAPAPSTTATAPSPTAIVGNVTSSDGWSGACLYMAANTSIMSLALTILILLLTMRKSGSPFTLFFLDQKFTLRVIQLLLTGLISAVVVSFIIGTSQHMGVQLNNLVIFFVFPIVAVIGHILRWFRE